MARGSVNSIGVKGNYYTATLTSTWTGASAPYTQTVTVTGILSSMNATISPIFSTTNATAVLEQTAWNNIGKIIIDNGSITATCFVTAPITAINIQIKEVV